MTLLDETQLGEFIDFLDSIGVTLCKWGSQSERYWAIGDSDTTREKLLAEYFGIDLDKVEQEKAAILEHLRAQQ